MKEFSCVNVPINSYQEFYELMYHLKEVGFISKIEGTRKISNNNTYLVIFTSGDIDIDYGVLPNEAIMDYKTAISLSSIPSIFYAYEESHYYAVGYKSSNAHD